MTPSRLHCRRCNQRVTSTEDYTVMRTHSRRVAVHALCPDPSAWRQCAHLDNTTNEQCQAVADGRTGFCLSHPGNKEIA